MTLVDDAATMPAAPVSGRYLAVSPYGVLGAVGWTVLTLLVATIAFIAAMVAAVVVLHRDLLSSGIDGFQRLTQVEQMALSLYGMLAMQLAVVGMALVAASRRGYRASDVLALRRPRSAWAYMWGPLLIMAVALAIGNILYYFMPDDTMQDMKLWLPLVNSEYWWLVFVVAAVGAPLSEEIWFRGFLLPSFAQTFAGSRPGRAAQTSPVGATVPILLAAVTTAMLFALAHVYSVQGAITVLSLGLTLSFIVWRSGSLWVSIVSHGIYNLAVFSYVKWLMPIAETAAGQAT